MSGCPRSRATGATGGSGAPPTSTARDAIHGAPAITVVPDSTGEAAEAPHKPVGQREYAEDVARLDDARAFRLKREAADAGGQRRNYG